MLDKPVQSFYHHYQRPVLQVNQDKEFDLLNNSVQSNKIPLQDKYEQILKNLDE